MQMLKKFDDENSKKYLAELEGELSCPPVRALLTLLKLPVNDSSVWRLTSIWSEMTAWIYLRV